MGDCGFIIPDLIVNKDAVLPREKKFDYLSDHIHFEEQTSKIIQAIVGETIVVNSAHDLLSLYNTFDTPQWIVTKNGDFAIKNGFIRGGGSKNTSGLIERKNRLTTLEKNIAENYDLILKSEKGLLVLTDELNEIISYFNKTSVDLEDAENELRDNEKRLFIINEEKKQIETTQKILQLEKEQYEGEAFDIDNEITAIRKKIDFVNNKISSETKAFEAEEKQSELITIKIEDQNKICTDLKLDLSKLLERNENYAKSLGQLQNFIDDGLKRFSQLKTDISNKSEKCKLYNEKIENAEKDVEIQSLSLSALSNTIEIKENALLDLETLLKQNKDSIENINLQISMVRDDKRDNELNLSEITIKKSNIETGIQEKYHYPVSILIQEHRNEVTEELALIENSGFKQFEKRLSLLKVQIQNLGEINHSAIREFEELKKRNDFIQGQHADLTNALEELNKIIIRINKITQNKFIETFNQINDKLSEIFPRLFEGGSGELKILEPSNLLETGVEFLIKPPGKKLTNLGLLSGGEKALCAIAFIFSIFLIKPSSFCIMDEIDAPLDDANVFRFNNLIKIIGEQSQILIITHNKLTMEFADILFGVTMEKKGVSKIVSVELDA
jgi:chromosome segregation protein